MMLGAHHLDELVCGSAAGDERAHPAGERFGAALLERDVQHLQVGVNDVLQVVLLREVCIVRRELKVRIPSETRDLVV
jgi:hypothetical protein